MNSVRLSTWILRISFIALVGCNSPPEFHIMLDSGHTDNQPGALGVRGLYEKAYNDALVQEVAELLQEEGSTQVALSHLPHEEVTLEERIARAEEKRADLFLSIHHDSVAEANLITTTHAGLPAVRSNHPVGGYSTFVAHTNPRLTESLLFAAELGAQMEAIHRLPFSQHPNPIIDQHRRLLNRRFGIFAGNSLAVLRGTTMPAVIFEIGFIVDEDDERYVRERMPTIARQIVAAVRTFQRRRHL